MAVIRMNFLSQCLRQQTNVTVCLPSLSFADMMQNRASDVYVPGMKYQVLWLLHGFSGDDSDFLHFTNITRYADDNKIAVVMPPDFNAGYEDTDRAAYQTFVVEELPTMLRAILPLSEKREDNFIAGLSMGGGGTGKIAVKYPENYAGALIMSAGGSLNPSKPRPGGPAFVDRSAELRELAKKNIADGKKVPKFWVTCGDKDGALEGAQYCRDFLKEAGYEVFYEEVPGYGHEWDFWDLTLRKALKEWLPIRHSVIYPEK